MDKPLSQFDIRVNPLPKNQHIKHADVSKVPESKWYAYTLLCEHVVYTRVRIRAARDYGFQEHYIMCPHKHKPLSWQAIVSMEAVSDAHVSNVSSGNAFVLPKYILRCDGHIIRNIRRGEGPEGETIEDHRIHTSGNPFPYSSKDREV